MGVDAAPIARGGSDAGRRRRPAWPSCRPRPPTAATRSPRSNCSKRAATTRAAVRGGRPVRPRPGGGQPTADRPPADDLHELLGQRSAPARHGPVRRPRRPALGGRRRRLGRPAGSPPPPPTSPIGDADPDRARLALRPRATPWPPPATLAHGRAMISCRRPSRRWPTGRRRLALSTALAGAGLARRRGRAAGPGRPHGRPHARRRPSRPRRRPGPRRRRGRAATGRPRSPPPSGCGSSDFWPGLRWNDAVRLPVGPGLGPAPGPGRRLAWAGDDWPARPCAEVNAAVDLLPRWRPSRPWRGCPPSTAAATTPPPTPCSTAFTPSSTPPASPTPAASWLHNQAAWLAACCCRRLDAAQAHARAAVRPVRRRLAVPRHPGRVPVPPRRPRCRPSDRADRRRRSRRPPGVRQSTVEPLRQRPGSVHYAAGRPAGGVASAAGASDHAGIARCATTGKQLVQSVQIRWRTHPTRSSRSIQT